MNKEPLVLTFKEVAGQSSIGVYSAPDGVEHIESDDPYLLSDGNGLMAPLPAVIVDGPIYTDSMGNVRHALAVSNLGPLPPSDGITWNDGILWDGSIYWRP